VEDGVLIIQERMSGTVGDDVSASLLEDLTADNRLQSGVGPGLHQQILTSEDPDV